MERSLNNQRIKSDNCELEKKFAVTQKQKRSMLEAENKVKIAERNGLLFLRFLLMLFGAGTYFYRQKVRNNKIIRSKNGAGRVERYQR
jgi:hypothetical protein